MKNNNVEISQLEMLTQSPLEYFAAHPTLIFFLISAIIAYMAYRFSKKSARLQNTIAEKGKYEVDGAIQKVTVAMQALSNHNGKVCCQKKLSEEEQLCVIYVLNSWENIAIGIKHKVFDEKVMLDSYMSTAIKIWQGFENIIKEKKSSNPMAYCNFELLMKRWTKKYNKIQKKRAKS